tara:strand:- start:863 stop:1057 length:195 start_codon:yes stop_codon:yes gene_type:complete
MIDIDNVEHNTITLKKTVKYLNGELKEVVEKQIMKNNQLINDFFDDLSREYQHIQTYEGGQDGN